MLNLKLKNQLFDLMRKYNVPIEFSDYVDGKKRSYYGDGSSGFICDTIIYCKNNEKLFVFEIYINPQLNEYQFYGLKMRPGKEALIYEDDRQSWKSMISHFSDWCYTVAYEFNNIDLWEQFKSHKHDSSFPVHLDEEVAPDEKFTVKEVENITIAFNTWRESVISELKINAEQIDILNNKIDTLIELSKFKPKRDWVGILISFSITMAYDFALDDSKLNKFAKLLYSAFNGLIKLLGQ